MTLNHIPQTFGEWFELVANEHFRQDLLAQTLANDAFAAGVASQQAEYDKLASDERFFSQSFANSLEEIHHLKAEIERLKEVERENSEMFADLGRYEAVVEAARELTLATVWMKSGSFNRLRAALAALDQA